MTDRNALIRGLDEAVREVLAYFEGTGRTSTASRRASRRASQASDTMYQHRKLDSERQGKNDDEIIVRW